MMILFQTLRICKMSAGVTSSGKLFFTAIAYMRMNGEKDIYEFYFNNRHQYVYTEQAWRFRESDELDG